MCLSGRCSRCQHDAIDAGINHHDLYAVVQHRAEQKVLNGEHTSQQRGAPSSSIAGAVHNLR